MIVEQDWDYDLHPGDCHPRKGEDHVWSVCCSSCAGTGVFPMPWLTLGAIVNPETDGCVSCKNSGRALVCA